MHGHGVTPSWLVKRHAIGSFRFKGRQSTWRGMMEQLLTQMLSPMSEKVCSSEHGSFSTFTTLFGQTLNDRAFLPRKLCSVTANSFVAEWLRLIAEQAWRYCEVAERLTCTCLSGEPSHFDTHLYLQVVLPAELKQR